MTVADLHPREAVSAGMGKFKTVTECEAQSLEDLPMIDKCGRIFSSEIFAKVIKYGGKEVVQGIFRDITGRKEIQRRLEFFRSMVDQSNDALFVIDPGTSQFLDVNQKACLDLGYCRDELLHMRVIDIEGVLLDESMWKEHVRKVLEEGVMMMESVYKRKDGTTFPIEVNIKTVKEDEKDYFIAVSRDITERKKAEKELQKVFNMKSEFISMVSHELRTPLSVIKESVNIVLDKLVGNVPKKQRYFLEMAKK